MTDLRDALAEALDSYYGTPRHIPSRTIADYILSDPAFREALVDAVAAAADGIAWEGARLSRSGIIDLNSDSLARAIVARMLGYDSGVMSEMTIREPK